MKGNSLRRDSYARWSLQGSVCVFRSLIAGLKPTLQRPADRYKHSRETTPLRFASLIAGLRHGLFSLVGPKIQKTSLRSGPTASRRDLRPKAREDYRSPLPPNERWLAWR
jgi:hypothetical protein